ncbi:MAG: hypothetical protein EBY03_02430 [Actinobacteria bacterium]|nr:hypothetical protein [Actinomycetota bacterium]
MTIEINNRSGQLVPSDKCLSLLNYAYGKLELHPECDLNLTFIDDKEMEGLHIKWMDLVMFALQESIVSEWEEMQ